MLPASGPQKRFENDQRKAKQSTLLTQAGKNSVRPIPQTRTSPSNQLGEGGFAPMNQMGLQQPAASPSNFVSQPVKQQPVDLSQFAQPSNELFPTRPAPPQIDFDAIRREVDMEELLSSPQVQGAVARAKLKQYFKNRNGNGVQDPEWELGAEVLNSLQKLL